jgi:hypothetical protein
MQKTKLPQPYGLRLEMILAKGFSADEALKLIRRNDAAELREKVNPETAWESFLEYANAHEEAIEAAVRNGYEFPFLTIGGIRSLLSIKFGKSEERDYRFRDGRIERLRLTRPELESLRKRVPDYWRFAETGTEVDRSEETVEISIMLA